MNGELRNVLHVLPEVGIVTQDWLRLQTETSVPGWSSGVITQWGRASYGVPFMHDERLKPLVGKIQNRLPKLVERARERALLSGRPADLIHAHFGPLAFQVSRTLSKWPKVPLVVTLYGLDATHHRFSEPPWVDRYCAMFQRSNAVIVEGPAMKARMVALGAAADRVHIVKLPVRPMQIQISAGRSGRVLMAGRLVEKKGHAVLLRAWERVAAAAPDARLVVVGSGPLEPLIRAAAQQMPSIEWHPTVNLETFVTLVASCEFAVFPSVVAADGDSEGGAPVTIPAVESIGLPVIVTDTDDLSWLAGHSARVVAAGSYTDLSEAILDTLGLDDAAYARLSKSCVEWASVEHSPANVAAQRHAIYESVVGR